MIVIKILTLVLYLLNQLNSKENISMIDIEYGFWRKDSSGLYYQMKFYWWYCWWLNLMNYLEKCMEPLIIRRHINTYEWFNLLKNNWFFGMLCCTVMWMTNYIRNKILVRARRWWWIVSITKNWWYYIILWVW